MKFITAVVMAGLLWGLVMVFPAFGSEDIPMVHGEAAYLLDVQSGQMLYSKNGDEELPPASTTKIMTALLAFERGNLQDVVTAGPALLNRDDVYGTQIYLAQGEQMQLKDLLFAVLLNSANDAAVLVAEHIGGTLSQFVDMMNVRATQLGMAHTHFVNPTGLNAEGHLTTAHDLALLAREAYQNPEFLKYTRTKTQAIPRTTPNTPVLMVNENKLLWRDASVNGMKTGYTSQAQNCLVASAQRDGRQLIGVILKSPGGEMFSDMQALLEYGFKNFGTTVYQTAGTKLTSIQVGKEEVGLVLAKDIYRTQRVGSEAPKLRLTISNLQEDHNSVYKGEKLGQLEVWEGQSMLGRVDLLSDREVQLPQNGAISYIGMGAAGALMLAVGFYGVIRQGLRLKGKRQSMRQKE